MPRPTPRVAPRTTVTHRGKSGGFRATPADRKVGRADQLDERTVWLRIPSISTGEGEAAELERAARRVVDRIRGAGGEGDLIAIAGGLPLAVGELQAADP